MKTKDIYHFVKLWIVTIKNRGSGLGTSNVVYKNVPIVGDGEDGTATITINNNSQVESIVVSNGGSEYTFARVDLDSVDFPLGITSPEFDVIIPPKMAMERIYTENWVQIMFFYILELKIMMLIL